MVLLSFGLTNKYSNNILHTYQENRDSSNEKGLCSSKDFIPLINKDLLTSKKLKEKITNTTTQKKIISKLSSKLESSSKNGISKNLKLHSKTNTPFINANKR